MIPLDFVGGLAAGLVVAAGLYLFLWWRARRTSGTDSPPEGAAWSPARESTASDSGPPSRPPFSAPLNGPVVPSGLPSRTDPPLRESTSAEPPAARAEDSAGKDRPLLQPHIPTETFRLSQRVILHVYAQGELPPGAVAPPGLCQAGIVDALGIPQAGLAAVLRRLEAAGILATERGHVRGHNRRLKVYRLSARGLEVAKELRGRSHGRPRQGSVVR